MNIQIQIEFNGKNYSGWQIQANSVTLQETIENSLSKLFGEPIKITGCSRTDAGVHAKQYFFNFKIATTSIPIKKMHHAINQFLPNDIIAKKSKLVSDSFHSTLNAKNKTYRYTILNNEFPTVFGQDFYYHVRQPLDIEKIIRASKLFVGKHDFSKPFTTHKIPILSGDMIYLFTDGFPDQFGGEKGKKFKYSQLKEKLVACSSTSAIEQKTELEKIFNEWKGKLEQVDDVLLIGIKI